MKNKSSALGIFCFLFCLFLVNQQAFSVEDFGQVVSGADTPDELSSAKSSNKTDPYVVNSGEGDVEGAKIKKSEDDFIFKYKSGDLSVPDKERKKLEDFGYTPMGTYENAENYLELDKKQMASEFRNKSSSAFTIAFIKNSYSYTSQNDIINRTVGEGYKHVKGGALHLRSDQYFFRKDYLNTFWSVGAGLGYNSGRAIFVGGERSDTTIRLWEIPLDLGLGLELPLYHWFKISGAAGPSVMGLYQNRSDYQKGEAGKNKIQVSYGEFASAQFKVNLSGLSHDLSYDLFTESKITNLLMNLEVRFHNYQNFQDDIKVSGTSFGLGFTFEYL